MGLYPKKIDVTATSGTASIESVHGIVMAVRVERSTGTPTITIAETGGTQETLINAQAFASNANKTPQKVIQDNAGTSTGLYTPYFLNGGLTVTWSGATNPSTITIYIKTV